jgi:hypothetical protein
MRRAIVIARCCSLLAALACARPVFADDVAPPGDAKAQASQLLTQGNQLSGEGSYPEALEKYQAAYAIYPSPKLLLNIGTTQRNLGRNAEAAETYEAYLRAPDREPGRVAEVERVIKEIDAVVGHVTVRATVVGSTVTIDGKDLGVAPFDRTLRVEPGAHKVVAEKAGMQAYVGTLTLKPGETQVAEADPLPPGVVTKTNTVTVETGRGQRIAAVIVGSTGIAAGIVGGVFGVLAIWKNDEAATHCSLASPEICDTEGVALGSTASQHATTSTVLLSVGGAALIGGIVLWVTAPSKKAVPAAGAHATSTGPTEIRFGLGSTRDAAGAAARFGWAW